MSPKRAAPLREQSLVRKREVGRALDTDLLGGSLISRYYARKQPARSPAPKQEPRR